MPRSAAGLGSFWIGGFDMTCRTLAATIALATVGLVTYQPASAETLTVTGWANGYRDVYITSPITAHAGAGTFQVTDGANSFQAWCVDLFHETNFGLAVNDYSTSTSLFDTGTIDKLGQLATGFLSMATDATNSAAFQLAAWEIISEPAGSYAFDSGAFQANGGSAASSGALTTALGWLNSLPTTSEYSVSFWVSPTHQDLVVFSPVPEPATYSLLLAGLGLMGIIVRRRMAARRDSV